MKCVIVAAGQGVRLRNGEELKPLVRLAGRGLIEHVILRCHAAGVDDFVVVGGYRGEELRAALEVSPVRQDVRITYVENPAWQRANGVSVAAARAAVGGEAFLLTMCDHLLDPAIMRDLLDAPPREDAVTLAVDYKIDAPVHDPDDVTRVFCDGERITAIGKGLDRFNCFDTGVFLCGPAMFDALAESEAAGRDSITAAMETLAARQAAFGHDIGGKLWIDVDDATAFGHAEAMLASGQL